MPEGYSYPWSRVIFHSATWALPSNPKSKLCSGLSTSWKGPWITNWSTRTLTRYIINISYNNSWEYSSCILSDSENHNIYLTSFMSEWTFKITFYWTFTIRVNVKNFLLKAQNSLSCWGMPLYFNICVIADLWTMP